MTAVYAHLRSVIDRESPSIQRERAYAQLRVAGFTSVQARALVNSRSTVFLVPVQVPR